MYPDPLTPKSYPDLLQEVTYDPFGLMPELLPPAPRVFLTPAEITIAKQNIATCVWAARGLELLLSRCGDEEVLPAVLPTPPDLERNRQAIALAEHNALAHALTGREVHRERALSALRAIAHGFPRWPVDGLHTRGGVSLPALARTYDLLAATGLSTQDEGLFRAMLLAAAEVSSQSAHHTCSNHNTHKLAARLAVASALGDLEGIHHALYGCRGANGEWHYGIIHQLRHDYLSDGWHWEGAAGYHFYTMMAMVEIAVLLQHLGVDLWHHALPTLKQTDGQDLHRAYGPRGTKTMKAIFDAPFYMAFPNFDVPLLHDSGLANLRGAYIWGIVYDKAYEAYEDEKYAWLLNRIEQEYPPPRRQHPELPMSLNTNRVEFDFARLRTAVYPVGRCSRRESTTVSLCGRHEHGCTLFPVHGSTVLRSDPDDEQAVGAFLYWGSHCAGHMAPANLHLDLAARGRRLTDAPRAEGYEDERHLTWCRSTIGHNTVTVDEQPMFPYDFPTESSWEADTWRDRIADGELVSFQPERRYKVVRAANENVYSGVRLDRTVIVTACQVLDVYRVCGERVHQYDWAMHVLGQPEVPVGAVSVNLGAARGYQHFTEAREVVLGDGAGQVCWRVPAGGTWAALQAPAGAWLVLARDPLPSQGDLGELEAPGPRYAALLRVRARDALFVALWTFDGAAGQLRVVSGDARGDLVLRTSAADGRWRWELPWQGAVTAHHQTTG